MEAPKRRFRTRNEEEIVMSRGRTILSIACIIGLFVVTGRATKELQSAPVSMIEQQSQQQAQEIAALEQTLAQRDRELRQQEQRVRETQRMAETAREQAQAAEARAQAAATPSTETTGRCCHRGRSLESVTPVSLFPPPITP
jgi:hypothetical protein